MVSGSFFKLMLLAKREIHCLYWVNNSFSALWLVCIGVIKSRVVLHSCMDSTNSLTNPKEFLHAVLTLFCASYDWSCFVGYQTWKSIPKQNSLLDNCIGLWPWWRGTKYCHGCGLDRQVRTLLVVQDELLSTLESENLRKWVLYFRTSSLDLKMKNFIALWESNGFITFIWPLEWVNLFSINKHMKIVWVFPLIWNVFSS